MALRRTKIVATLGPATDAPGVLAALIAAGMDVARLNLSHGTLAQHAARLRAVREAAAAAGRPVGVLLDLRGPEVRLNPGPEGRLEAVPGARFDFDARPQAGAPPAGAATPGRRAVVGVDHPGLPQAVRPGDVILVDDGNLVFRVERISGPVIETRVVAGGPVIGRKKLSLPGVALDLPVITPEDREAIAWAVDAGVDFIAASFIRSGADAGAVRDAIQAVAPRAAPGLVAKIERAEAVDDLAAICGVADAIMVARGDLGIDLPAEDVPLAQKRIIARARAAGRPVITATQMLESMVERPRPTRAEASDVANAILDGTDAVMLSAETAVGKYPVAAVEFMARIAARAEAAMDWEALLAAAGGTGPGGVPPRVADAIAYATCAAAHALDAAAIITPTSSGRTARLVARIRPRAPIVALTPDPRVANALTLVWGVRPLPAPPAADTDELIRGAVAAAATAGVCAAGDLVAVTAGVPIGVAGTTNLLKIETVPAIGASPGRAASSARRGGAPPAGGV